MNCIECNGKCIFTNTDLTCTECGLEQNYPNLVSDFHYFNQSEVMIDPKYILNRNENTLFQSVLDSLHLPDDVVQLAKQLYKDFKNDNKENACKNGNRNKELICACILYSSLSMNKGKVTQNEIEDKVFQKKLETGSINWAKKALNCYVQTNNCCKYKFMFDLDVKGNIIREKAVKNIKQFSEHMSYSFDTFKKLNITANKIIDKIEKHDKNIIKYNKTEIVIAGLIIVSCRLNKLNTKSIEIAVIMLISLPTISKIEKQILNVIFIK